MTFARQMLKFFDQLEAPDLPKGVTPLMPFKKSEVMQLMTQFYSRFYDDELPRTLLFGINPGRLGAGKTGIGFTDPVRLKEQCGIDHDLDLKPETSSVFIYDMIDKYGGVKDFYSRFHFTAVSPVGYVHNGLNCNYYDTPALKKATLPFVMKCLDQQLEMNVNKQVAYSIGKGKNYEILQKLNDQHGYFGRIDSLPHPRWVMQYRYKSREQYLDQYRDQLSRTVEQNPA